MTTRFPLACLVMAGGFFLAAKVEAQTVLRRSGWCLTATSGRFSRTTASLATAPKRKAN